MVFGYFLPKQKVTSLAGDRGVAKKKIFFQGLKPKKSSVKLEIYHNNQGHL
jgi:hypothetical protein